MFQRKTEIFRKPKKHMKRTFRQKILKNKSVKMHLYIYLLDAAAQKEADMKENNNTTNTINAGGVNIKVTVTPMKEQEGCLKANASIILKDVFKVTGIRIGISQNGNVFVSMPDYKTGRLDDNGKDIYQDMLHNQFLKLCFH